MTDRQHTVILGDGSTARFSTPERAEQYARARRHSDVIDAALSALAKGCALLAAMLMVLR